MKTSICPICKKEKDPRSKLCLGCHFPISDTKYCNGCGRTLPRESFNLRKDSNGKFKRRSRCKECESKASASYLIKMSDEQKDERIERKKTYNQKHRLENNSYARIRQTKKWNGNPESIKAYIDSHNRTCEICGENESVVGTLHIDHDHSQNAFRGLLCSTCNTGLGQFKDDIKRLLSAIEYLKRPLPDLSKMQQADLNVEIDETDGIKQENIIRGERASWSKLKTEQVQEIRSKLAEGIKIAIIAKEYGVSRMAIYAIRNGKNWKPL